MSKYIHFTPEEKDRAYHTNIIDILTSQGEEVKSVGKEYVWESQYGTVNIKDNVWYSHYTQKGGTVVDFLKIFYNKSYVEAMLFLLNNNFEMLDRTNNIREETQELNLPIKYENMNRIYAYLVNDRGISRDVLTAFVHAKMIYESNYYHNAVFVGYDKFNQPKHVHLRGTSRENSFKSNISGSENKYSFHWNGTSDKLYLFEAPIDMLSFISMNPDGWQQHSYAAACSVSDAVAFQCIEDNPNIKKVYICFDNDEPGQNAAQRVTEKMYSKGIPSAILTPTLKDWNEDLVNLREEEEQCPMVQFS